MFRQCSSSCWANSACSAIFTPCVCKCRHSDLSINTHQPDLRIRVRILLKRTRVRAHNLFISSHCISSALGCLVSNFGKGTSPVYMRDAYHRGCKARWRRWEWGHRELGVIGVRRVDDGGEVLSDLKHLHEPHALFARFDPKKRPPISPRPHRRIRKKVHLALPLCGIAAGAGAWPLAFWRGEPELMIISLAPRTPPRGGGEDVTSLPPRRWRGGRICLRASVFLREGASPSPHFSFLSLF